MTAEPDGGAASTRRPEGPVARLRARVEELDRELVSLLGERVRLARAIGRAKREAGAATLDPEREAAVIRRAVEAGRREHLPEEDVRALFWTLVGLCRDAQIEAEP